jgi:hypothetical protein
MRSASRASSAGSLSWPWYPGTSGTPACSISAFAAALLPIAAIAFGGGPMKTRPASAQALAKSSFSLRKP